MLYKMNKPSANMNLSEFELQRMIHEQEVSEYKEEQERKKLQESSMNREALERESYLNNYSINAEHYGDEQRQFLANAKASSSLQVSTLSIIFKFKVEGINPAPIPCIL